MGSHRPWLLAVFVASLAHLVGLAACGGTSSGPRDSAGDASAEAGPGVSAGAGSVDAGAMDTGAIDAGATGRGAADSATDGSQADSTVCPGACVDGADAAPDGGIEAGAPDAQDGGTASLPDEVCRLVWTDPVDVQSAGNYSLAVDPSGNTYVQVDYYSSVTIAKIDAQCRLVWTRVLGASPDAGPTTIASKIAVDSSSNLTVAGYFYGTIDFGTGPISSPGPGYSQGFVVRLDADGNTSFCDIYPTEYPTLLPGSAAGVSSVLLFDYQAAECSMTPGCSDAGGADAGSSFYSFVQIDGTGHETVRHPFAPSYTFVMSLTAAVLDPAGNIWALSQNDGINGSNPALLQLSQYGQVSWSQPFTHGDLFALGPSGGVVLDVGDAGTTLQAFGGDGGLVWTQASSQSGGGGQPLYMAIDSTGAIYATPASSSSSIGVEVFDPQGHLLGVRAGPDINDLYMAFGVDPGGTAILAGYLFGDGGFANLLVRLGP